MSKDDIAGMLGALLSSIFAFFGFLWSIGVLQLISSFLAGAFTTYLVQRRLQIESEKRKIRREHAIVMRDDVYGPLFMEVSEILESLKSVKRIDYRTHEELKKIMTHYLFFTIRQELKNKLSELLNRIDKYENIHIATEAFVQNAIRTETKKAHKVDIGSDRMGTILRLNIGEITFSAITLIDALLRRITPREFVETEIKKWGKDISINVSIGGKARALDAFESLYDSVLHEIEKEPLYAEEKKQRERLIKELEAFLEQIRVFVDLAR